MTPSASSRIHIPGINPAVLKWAREWRGKTTEEAATKLRKRAADIVAWEQGQGGPTVKQARALAGFYERPFLEFFLAAPPELDLPELVPDYRMHAGESPSQDTRGLRAIQQWAEAKRVDALDLFNELDLEIPQIPSSLFAVVRDDPEVMAARSRDAIAFSIHEQMELTKHDAEALPTILRDRQECLGVLTFRRPDLKRFRARGICIAPFPLPVIIVQNEAPRAQSFTLMHEFGHILLRQGAVSGNRDRSLAKSPVEDWCDRFAAAVRMPQNQIASLISNVPPSPLASISDETLSRIATTLRVSPHAALIRLVQFGYIADAYYWDVKKPQFDREAQDAKSFGRAKYYGVRYRSTHGDLYTGLVLEAWGAGKITNHNAAEYLGIKNLSHLQDIRTGFAAP